MRSADLGRSGLRLRVACAVLLGCFALLGLRAGHLSMIDRRGAERGVTQTSTTLQLAAARGLIVDRSGAELAVTVSAPSVYAIPASIEDVEGTAQALARALRSDPASLRKRLGGKKSFVYVERWVGSDRAEAVERLALSGIGLVHEPRRAYPHHALAGRLLGFANIDGEGVRGVEQQEDSWLRGKVQRVAVERDARRRLLVSSGLDPRSAAGGDIALSIDATLQAEIDAALQEVVAETGARRGIVVSMDPRNGEILALSELPGFDPNDFRVTPYAATRSRAFLDALEPGSALKPFVVAAALQHGAMSPDQVIDCEEGFFRVPGKTLRDIKPFGVMDLAGVLRVSSNIGAAKIGFAVGPEAHHDVLRRFGFGEPTGSGFPEESAGLLRSWQDWRPVDHATISFGQGIGVTAIQLAAATAALANRGLWLQPRLVTARRAPGGRWQPLAPEARRQAVRPEVANAVLGMMETVVSEEGTGRRASLEEVRVAGKTGTAQKLDPETGAYSTKRYLAWFTGVAPADDPKIVVVVMLDEPAGRAHSGGATAAPLFARIAAEQLARHGILTRPELPLPRMASIHSEADTKKKTAAPTPAGRTEPPPVRAEKKKPTVATAAIATLDDRLLLPDFSGLNLEQVKRITSGIGLEVEMQGDGHVVSQYPAPGTILAGGTRRVSVRFAHRGGGG